MAKSAKIYQTALSRLNAYIKKNNLRPSSVRRIVLERICSLPQPFTAEQLIEACQEERVSVGSIYNSLNLFILAQILHATNRQRGKNATEYEVSIGSQARMHVICTECGRVTEIHDKAISSLIQERKYSNFNMQHFSLYVYGVCRKCAQQTKNE